MDNIILRCDNNINGIFTAIYDAFVYKNQMQKENHEVYRDNISIEIGIGGNYTLFSKMIDIETDEVKVQKTILTIQKKLGFKIYETVFDALCHYSDNRATIVLGDVYKRQNYDSVCASEGIFNTVIIIPCFLHARMKSYTIEKLQHGCKPRNTYFPYKFHIWKPV